MDENEINHKQQTLLEDDLPSTSKQKFVTKNTSEVDQIYLGYKTFGKNVPFKQYNEKKFNRKSIAKQKHPNEASVSCSLPLEKKRKPIDKKIQTSKFYIKWPTKFKFADDSSITGNNDPSIRTVPKSLKNQKFDSSTKRVVSNKYGEKFNLEFIELTSQSKGEMENIKHMNTLTDFEIITNTTSSLVNEMKPTPSGAVKQQSKIRCNDTEAGNVSDVPSTSKRTLNETSHMPVFPLKLIKIDGQKIVEVVDLNLTTFHSSKKVITTMPIKSACERPVNSLQDVGRSYSCKDWDAENVECTVPHRGQPKFSIHKKGQTTNRDINFPVFDDVECNDENVEYAAPLSALIDQMEQATSSDEVKFLVSCGEACDDDNAEYILPDAVPTLATNSSNVQYGISSDVSDDDSAEYIVPDIVPASDSAVAVEQTINSLKVRN